MNRYSRDDIWRMVEEEDVEFIRLQFTDILGTMKNIAITASQLEKALKNQCTFDGTTIDGFLRIEEPEMYFYPDLDTFQIFPWRPQQGKVARLICNIYKKNGEPFEGDSRNVLRRVAAKAAEMGYEFNVGPECEFFLFHTDEEGRPTTSSHDKAGFYDLGPMDLGENARRDMVLTLEDMGFEIESSYHEMAPAQHEIDFKSDEALATADNIMTYKLAVRTIAKRHGMYATFMPKPKEGVNGSGMRLFMMLTRGGKNVFDNTEDQLGLSKEAYYFVGGLLKHMKAMTAILNPTVNSYKRLVKGYEAPVSISWSTNNRTSLIRIPDDRGSRTKIALQSPDAACNPYLAIAVCLAAGLDGIENQMEPPERITKNLFEMNKKQLEADGIELLPDSLIDAVKAMQEDTFIRKVLGGHIADTFIQSKKEEWSEYKRHVSDWELEHYLYKI
ncbi:MAG: type I glutamate--ammonia ligase [Lachnospiraceae bacterium]|nr:type I glutamate--ammonia ligase [Lachnospiraceae bacterium]